MGWLTRVRNRTAGFGDFARRIVNRIASRIATVWGNAPAKFETIGRVNDRQNQWYQWQLGATERHCKDCLHLNGQIHTAQQWRAAGIMPQSPDLECGGWNCDCSLVLVDNYEGEGEGVIA